MSFLNSDEIEKNLDNLFTKDFDKNLIECGCYELRLGNDYYISSDGKGSKKISDQNPQIIIPSGQFALLTTKETLGLTSDFFGLISIKAGIKFKGLVNISGFHVDPGFKGILKFSVYNAGARDIVLDKDQRVFPIWFGKFTTPETKPYNNSHNNFDQNKITSKDIMDVSGKIPSPASLSKKLKNYTNIALGAVSLLTLLSGIVVTLCIVFWNTTLNNLNILRNDVKEEKQMLLEIKDSVKAERQKFKIHFDSLKNNSK
ncbi:MAG: deoxycytidine triphosphate deaminase [Bacteroidetes bacterium]|nr:deoxycytidine triphosphate deaminase [Bacteroidota bacterium]